MVRVVNIDHISIRVGDFAKSKEFYGKLFKFLGFKVLGEYDNHEGRRVPQVIEALMTLLYLQPPCK